MGSYKNDLRDTVHFKADRVQFRLYSKEEILKLSVVEIFNPAAFNQLGHPLDNGLYDLKMGPFSDRNLVVCGTCHLQAEFCPGHIGHIALPMPAVNPLFYANIQKVLKISCIHCHRFKMAECFKTMFQGQMKLLDLGLINQAQEVCDMVNRREESEDKKSGKMNQDEESSLDIKLKDYIEEELRKHEELNTQ
ncbi:DNA-directed RNA polymerase I subunit rpa1 [Eurytemora carolleeae]|uniref:DNA-directed RNA polymerase I subunit rpa1 n=1 Tax=Eurytemora carolleeae TaxID=1294199 RepID=UPI000C7562CD|nr:DNA-directed RNA polymerase I subunit rpa1 [Eurytemora carolleeae]|eukprot:XP_023348472.1 DNA-directed RNA polymerase I subunit rpa1-like [Eurytemora affinis]